MCVNIIHTESGDTSELSWIKKNGEIKCRTHIKYRKINEDSFILGVQGWEQQNIFFLNSLQRAGSLPHPPVMQGHAQLKRPAGMWCHRGRRTILYSVDLEWGLLEVTRNLVQWAAHKRIKEMVPQLLQGLGRSMNGSSCPHVYIMTLVHLC